MRLVRKVENLLAVLHVPVNRIEPLHRSTSTSCLSHYDNTHRRLQYSDCSNLFHAGAEACRQQRSSVQSLLFPHTILPHFVEVSEWQRHFSKPNKASGSHHERTWCDCPSPVWIGSPPMLASRAFTKVLWRRWFSASVAGLAAARFEDRCINPRQDLLKAAGQILWSSPSDS